MWTRVGIPGCRHQLPGVQTGHSCCLPKPHGGATPALEIVHSQVVIPDNQHNIHLFHHYCHGQVWWYTYCEVCIRLHEWVGAFALAPLVVDIPDHHTIRIATELQIDRISHAQCTLSWYSEGTHK